MRHRPRPVRRLCALALAGSAALLGGASSTPGATVTVTVTEMRSERGVVRACMTTDPVRFPSCNTAGGAHSVVVPAGGAVTLTFAGVAPGRYAIALLHDENNNGKIDRAMGMMPKEGFGFSRDARVRMGPPRFDAAAFEVGTESVSKRIRMRYML
ncbi:DUF2141 domain-containing protein [Leptolyngbya sp. 15MV]|nr:DUF2141 domain-containing protein [Leptolyngbya sp. 15MV]